MSRSRQITGLVTSIATLLAMGVAVAKGATISSRPTFDCAKAKSPLALLICLSGEETARADWDFKIAHWAGNFSLDEGERAAFWKDQDQWSKSLNQKCGLTAPPFSRQQTSCVIDAYKERAALYRSKLSGDALAEFEMAPEQLLEIQEALAKLGFFDGEADGEFGPLTRVAIRRYQKANGLPQNNFLTIAQSRALLEGQTARSLNAGGSPARAVLSQETPPQSPPQQQPAPARRAVAEPFAEPPKQYSIVEVANELRACRPAFSNNCITLEKGERVVVLAWQIDDKPRRGLYCLRPIGMSECYYADLTVIEINGVPVPTIGMDNPPSVQRVEEPPSIVPPQLAPTQRATDALLPRENQSSNVAPTQVGGGISKNLLLTGNDLLTFCFGAPDSIELFTCKVYLRGAREMVLSDAMIDVANRPIRAEGGTPAFTAHPNVCAPPDAGEKIFYDTAIAALRESGPSGNILTAGFVVGQAWSKRWPCKP